MQIGALVNNVINNMNKKEIFSLYLYFEANLWRVPLRRRPLVNSGTRRLSAREPSYWLHLVARNWPFRSLGIYSVIVVCQSGREMNFNFTLPASGKQSTATCEAPK